jgi:hypothetical protein
VSATSTLRRNGIYQRVLQIIRWQILPPLFGISTIVLTASAIYTFVTLAKYRIELSERERKGEFCPEMTDSPALIGHSKLPDVFATSSPCWPTHISVKKGKRYRVILEVVEPWIESENSYTSPIGIDFWAGTWLQNIEAMIGRRSMRGRLFQPLIRISNASLSKVQTLNMSHAAGRTFVGVFTAGLNGELFFFVNERMISINGVTTEFYTNNRGSATVELDPL